MVPVVSISTMFLDFLVKSLKIFIIPVLYAYLECLGFCCCYITSEEQLHIQYPCASCRYKGWFHAIHRTWMIEGAKGAFRGSIPRVIWYVPASALTFMAVEFLREKFSRRLENEQEEVASISIDKKRIFK